MLWQVDHVEKRMKRVFDPYAELHLLSPFMILVAHTAIPTGFTQFTRLISDEISITSDRNIVIPSTYYDLSGNCRSPQ
jgi:hypothetical protein